MQSSYNITGQKNGANMWTTSEQLICCTVQYKLNAQFLRFFSLHDDVNDAHRGGANRLKNKNKMSFQNNWNDTLRCIIFCTIRNKWREDP